MRAVRKHTDCPWALLYIDRWLKAPMQMADGSLIGRERGTADAQAAQEARLRTQMAGH